MIDLFTPVLSDRSKTVPNDNGSHYNLAISSSIYHTLEEIDNLHTVYIECVFSVVVSLYFENTEFVIYKESQGKHTGTKNYTYCIFLSINMETLYVENTNSVHFKNFV